MTTKLRLKLMIYNESYYKQPKHIIREDLDENITYLTDVFMAIPPLERRNIQITTSNFKKYKYENMEQIMQLYLKHKEIEITYSGKSINNTEYIPTKN